MPPVTPMTTISAEKLLRLRVHAQRLGATAPHHQDHRGAAAIAESGVDLISVGWLTHSARVLDIGLDHLADLDRPRPEAFAH